MCYESNEIMFGTDLESSDVILFNNKNFGQHLLTFVDSKTKWNIEKMPFLTILREFQNENMDWRSQQVLTKYFLSKTMMFQLSKFVSTILLRDLMVILSQSEFFHENQYFPKSWKNGKYDDDSQFHWIRF